MSIQDELKRIEDALRGDGEQVQSWYATHRKPIIIGVVVLLLIALWIVL
jgi:hypothetical protein